MARILLVEGETAVAEPLARALARAGHTLTTAGTGRDGLALATDGTFDIVLVDATLPDADGHDVCDALHAQRRGPVVILSENRAQADRDTWRNGAEDYVVKPIRAAEAVSLVRAVLRRWQRGANDVLRVGPLELDAIARHIYLDGTDLELTPKLVALLTRLMRDAGRVVTREQLMHDVWGDARSKRTLDVHVGWLRAALHDDFEHPRFIHTVRGVGFRLASAVEIDGDRTRATARERPHGDKTAGRRRDRPAARAQAGSRSRRSAR